MAFATTDRPIEVTSFDESKTGEKGLSDAAIIDTLSVPVIDLYGLNSPNRRAAIVDQIRSAASEWGAFQVVNHGVPGTELDGIINAVKAFHEQPPEAKRVYHTGEGFCYGTNIDPGADFRSDHFRVSTSPLGAAAIPEICRREVVEWDARVAKVGEALMELLFEGLGLGSGRFRELTCLDGRMFFGMCYPYRQHPEPVGQTDMSTAGQTDLTVGMKSHINRKFLTVVLQNRVPGFQMQHGGDWVDVEPIPGGLIVNVGDLLQVMSNDEYKSVQHRVRANSSSELRISAVTFFNVGKYNETDQFGPLPELVSPENPTKYPNFTFGEFGEAYISKDMDNKTVVETVKI